MKKIRKSIVMCLAVLLFAGVSSAAVPGCGNGFELIYSETLEGLVSEATQGNVNGDGYVCAKTLPETGRFAFIIIDNNTQGQ